MDQWKCGIRTGGRGNISGFDGELARNIVFNDVGGPTQYGCRRCGKRGGDKKLVKRPLHRFRVVLWSERRRGNLSKRAMKDHYTSQVSVAVHGVTVCSNKRAAFSD